MEDKLFKTITSKKFIAILVLSLAALFALGWGILVWNENRVIELDENAITLADPADYRTAIEVALWERDDVSITDDYVYLYGWIIKPGTTTQKVAIHVVLKDTATGQYDVVPTDVVERTDVTEAMADGCAYDLSGFSVMLPHWDELDETDYEIFVQFDLNEENRVTVPLQKTLKQAAEELANGQ